MTAKNPRDPSTFRRSLRCPQLADDHGIRVGRKRVARLMWAAGLRGLQLPKFVTTTVANPAAECALDTVDGEFSAVGRAYQR